MAETTVNSFVLRFVQEKPRLADTGTDNTWRGVIRHVQSNHEKRFTRMEDAVSFMAEFLNLSEDDQPAVGLSLNE